MTKTKTVLIIFILLLFTLACSALSPVTATPDQPSSDSSIPLTEADVPRVTAQDAKAAFDSGEAIIVDVRSQAAYEASHVDGALSIPLNEFETNIGGIDLPKDRQIITYCTWPSEHTSARAAFLLLNNGYANVSALLGGFEAWAQAGYPVEP